MTKVSIIIPNYNASQYLPYCLDSCLEQGKEVLKEIVVVDDHSTDDSWQVLESYQRRFPEVIKLFTNPSKGACAARNFGFSISTGEYIQWLDADDIIGPHKLIKQLQLLQASPSFIVGCLWQRFYDDPYLANTGSKINPPAELRGNTKPVNWLCHNTMMIPACWLASKKLFKSIAPWDESLSINQDGEFFTRAIAASKGVLFCSEAIVYYRSGLPDSVSRYKPEKTPCLFRSVQSYERTLFHLEDSVTTRQAVAENYQAFIITTFPYYKKLRQEAQTKLKALDATPDISKHLKSRKSKKVVELFGWNTFLWCKYLISTFKKLFGYFNS